MHWVIPQLVHGMPGPVCTGTPSYLSERLHPYVPSRTLRSSSSADLHVPRTNLHFGSRSFHIAAPTAAGVLALPLFVRLKP